MKQRITSKDWHNALSHDQSYPIRSWWKPKRGDWFYTSYGFTGIIEDLTEKGHIRTAVGIQRGESIEKHNVIPLLTIGQMMHYLRDHGIDYSEAVQADEPCDAIWQTIVSNLPPL